MNIRAILFFIFTGFCFAIFWAKGTSEEPLNPKKQIFDAYNEADLLNFKYYSDVHFIAKQFTDATPHANRTSVNFVTSDPKNLTILLVDTEKLTGELDPGKLPPYFTRIPKQCVSLPAIQLILCDVRLLDSIPRTLEATFEGGTHKPQPPVLMQWIIGHEIAHIVLKHGSKRQGVLAFAASGEKIVKSNRYNDQPSLESSAHCGVTFGKKERNLFVLETEADRYVINRLNTDSSFPVRLSIGSFVDQILQLHRKERDLQKVENGQPVNVTYSKDRHPPFLFRLANFLAEVDRVYGIPTKFSPTLDDICLTSQPTENVEYDYFFEGFYIRDDYSQSKGSVSTNFLRNAQGLSNRVVFGQPEFPPGFGLQLKTQEQSSTCVEDERYCLQNVLDEYIVQNVCDPRNEINRNLQGLSPRGGVSERWDLTVASYQQLVIAVNCWSDEGLDFEDVLFSLGRLAQVDGQALTLDGALLTSSAISRSSMSNKSLAFSQLAELLEDFGWYTEAVDATELALNFIKSEDKGTDRDKLWLTYKHGFLSRFDATSDISLRKSLAQLSYRAAIDYLEKYPVNSEQELDLVRHVLFHSLSTEIFLQNQNPDCEKEGENLFEKLAEVPENVSPDLVIKAMMYANQIQFLAACGKDFNGEFFREAQKSIQARLEMESRKGNSHGLQDAIRGINSLLSWAYISGREVERQVAADMLLKYWPYSNDKAPELWFKGISLSTDGRLVPIDDMISKVPYIRERYKEANISDTVYFNFEGFSR